MTDRQGKHLTNFLVKSLGYVHIQSRRASCVVTLNERSAHPVAVVGSLQWIAEHGIERVVIRADDQPREPQLLLDRDRAFSYLGTRADAWALRAALYTAKPVPLERTTLHKELGLVQHLLNANMDEELRLRILAKILGEYLVIARRDPSSGQFLIDQASRTWQSYQAAIGPLRPGVPFTAIRDRSYGRWAACGYNEAAAGGVPTVHDVEATMGAGTPTPIRVSYRRLLLPYRREGVERLLIASVVSA